MIKKVNIATSVGHSSPEKVDEKVVNQRLPVAPIVTGIDFQVFKVVTFVVQHLLEPSGMYFGIVAGSCAQEYLEG